MFLRQRIAEVTMKEGDRVEDYITKVESLYDELRRTGVEVDDTEVVTKLLLGLPKSWKHLATAVEMQTDVSRAQL
ncbi:hypothetical protein ACXWPL_09850, partial [Streptococcus pyogenes]